MCRSSEKPSKSAQSPGQVSHQEEKFEDEYGGSTEEEKEEEGRGEEAAGPANATSASQGEEGLSGWCQVHTDADAWVLLSFHTKETKEKNRYIFIEVSLIIVTQVWLNIYV